METPPPQYTQNVPRAPSRRSNQGGHDARLGATTSAAHVRWRSARSGLRMAMTCAPSGDMVAMLRQAITREVLNHCSTKDILEKEQTRCKTAEEEVSTLECLLADTNRICGHQLATIHERDRQLQLSHQAHLKLRNEHNNLIAELERLHNHIFARERQFATQQKTLPPLVVLPSQEPIADGGQEQDIKRCLPPTPPTVDASIAVIGCAKPSSGAFN